MYEGYIGNSLPPYLNPAMQPYLDPGIGYMSQYPMYGPTYGQFSPNYWPLMPTPYGGGLLPPNINPYYYTILQNPIKGFFTFSIPVFQAPKGLHPAFFKNYLAETQLEGAVAATSGVISTATTLLGSALGGPLGGIVGGLMGMGFSTILGKSTGRIMQIHETANLLNLATGGNEYGVGISMSQASELYKMFTHYGAKHASFTAEEYQLMYSELAKNSLIPDTGDFEEVKEHLKKMKNVVLKLQDLFQNGDIKAIVDALHQLRMSGVNVTDLADVSLSSSVAASILGQKAKDYITNTVANAAQVSQVAGVSTQGLIELRNTITLGMPENSYKIQGMFLKGASTKELIEKFYNLVTGSMQETNNPETAQMLRAKGLFSIQDYMVSALEAGLLEYNKEHKTSYNLLELSTNTQLMHEISTKYAPKAMQKLMTRFNGDALEIYSYLANKDTSFLTGINDPMFKNNVLLHIKNLMDFMPTFNRYMASHSSDYEFLAQLMPGRFNEFIKLVEIAKQNPQLFDSLKEERDRKIALSKRDTDYYNLVRDHSLSGRIHEILQSIQYRAALMLNHLIPQERSFAIAKEDRLSAEIKPMMKLVKETGFAKDIQTFPQFVTLPTPDIAKGAMYKLFGDGSTTKIQTLLSTILGVSSLGIDNDFVNQALFYKRASDTALSRYIKKLDEFIKNPTHSNFAKEYEGYFNYISNPDIKEPFVAHGIDFTTQDSEAKDIFKRLTQEVVELTRALKELSLKPHLTEEDKKQMHKYQEEIQTAKRSLTALYTSLNYGPADLLKLLGKDVTTRDINKLSMNLELIKQNSPDIYKKIVEGFAKLEGIDTKVASHILDKYSKAYNSPDVVKAWALKSGKTDLFTQDKVPLLGGMMNFVASGGGKLVSEVYKQVGSLHDLLEGLKELNKIKKDMGHSGSLYDSDTNNLISILMAARDSKLSPEKLKAVAKFESELKEKWNAFTGGRAITVDGVTIKSAEDFLHASTKVQTDFLKQVGTGFLEMTALRRLGSRLDPLYDKEGKLTAEGTKDLSTIFTKMVTFKDGKFVLKKSIEEELSNQDVKKVLRDLGFKPNELGIQRFLNELNGSASSKLDRTNELLQKILDALVGKKRPAIQLS